MYFDLAKYWCHLFFIDQVSLLSVSSSRDQRMSTDDFESSPIQVIQVFPTLISWIGSFSPIISSRKKIENFEKPDQSDEMKWNPPPPTLQVALNLPKSGGPLESK
jgi:hypothetical protein